jgi:hypothetical protein
MCPRRRNRADIDYARRGWLAGLEASVPGSGSCHTEAPARLSARAEGDTRKRAYGSMAQRDMSLCTRPCQRVGEEGRPIPMVSFYYREIDAQSSKTSMDRDSEQELQVQNPHLLTKYSTVTLTAAKPGQLRGTFDPARRGPWVCAWLVPTCRWYGRLYLLPKGRREPR